jgi:S-methylmethionine-dependent homocysteine/selenocysteine methylase
MKTGEMPVDAAAFIHRAPVVLTEGAIIECLKRGSHVELDPWILNAGLVYDPAGRAAMARLYGDYLKIGTASGLPMLTMAPTWRADPDRLTRAGYSDFRQVNADAVRFLADIRDKEKGGAAPIFVGGIMACRGDAYRPEEALDTGAARSAHASQAHALADAGAEFIMAATLPAAGEAIGMAQALAATGTPYIISFVIGTDGCLLDGDPMARTIATIDDTASPPPVGYMANCVHPAAFAAGLERVRIADPRAARRVLGLQANTSPLPHDQLNGRKELDTMAPEAFARSMADLHRRFGIRVLGGCCGTGPAHIAALARKLQSESTVLKPRQSH